MKELSEKGRLLMLAFAKDLENGKEFYSRLVQFAEKRFCNINDAEDAVCDFYSVIPARMHNFEYEIDARKITENRELKNYLLRCFSNYIKDVFRKERKHRNSVKISELLSKEEGDITYFCLNQTTLEPWEIFQREEESELVRKAIDSPEIEQKYSKILKDFYFKGYKCREIAKEYNVSVGTVKNRIHRGRKIIEDMLTRLKPAA